MKWSYKDPSYGDMVRVMTGTIYHFGIYVSDDEVIQFGLTPSLRAGVADVDVEVLATDIDTFLAGGFLEVCEFDKSEKKKNRTPEETVKYARGKMGTKGYNILYNNCEHFANECISGNHVCRQAEDLRAMFRKIPVVDVYIATLPKDEPIGTVECKERRKEIQDVSNEQVKREKYFAWELLCYALERSFGMRAKKLNFTKEKYGAWSVEGAEISISHSGDALAVAVSRTPVGIDIEKVHSPRSDRMAEFMMTDEELVQFEPTPEEQREERLISVWTAKEAIFKYRKIANFIPKDMNTLSSAFKTDSVLINGEKYMWTVATDTPEKIRIFNNIDLTKNK